MIAHRVFIDVDDRRRECPAAERLIGRLEITRQGVDLIPERLRLDDEALARHHSHLPFEREVIGVLGDRDTHGKRRCIPAARDQRRRRRRGDHRTVAGAAILLSVVVLDLVRELDRGDPLGRLVLSRHRRERTATGGAVPLIRGQLVVPLDDRQVWLRPRAMPRGGGPHRGRRGRRRVRLVDLRLDAREILPQRELELFGVGQPAQPRELRGQLADLLGETLVLAIQEETDLTERLDITLLGQRHHARIGSSSSIGGKRKCGERGRR
jgi:hypothetical protein